MQSVKDLVFVIVNTVSLTVGHTVFIIHIILYCFRAKQITPGELLYFVVSVRKTKRVFDNFLGVMILQHTTIA